MRKKGRSGPTSKLHNCIFELRDFVVLVAEGGGDEAGKQGMAVARRGSEFRMELATDEPWMPGDLDNLDQGTVGGIAGDTQARPG